MNKKKKIVFGKFLFNIIFLVFNVIIAFIIIMAILVYIGYRTHLLKFEGRYEPLFTIILMVIASSIIGTILGTIYSYRMLKPIEELSIATKKIADGNFKVKIDEIPVTDDDSDLNQLIRNFNEMADRLSQVDTLRNDFIANVSHEFKTPLATIQGYVTLLEDDSLTKEERQKYCQIIFKATEKLTNLTSNILKISKLDNGTVTLNKKEYNLSEQIREVIILLEKSWMEKEIDFDLSLPDISIYSDESLLQQVWQNIISNAIKFSNKGQKVMIYVSSIDDMIAVTISDAGIGMSEETIKHMFDKFYQGDKSHVNEGNGLGMTLTKKIVTLLEGKIEVESKLGNGTKITVYLPSVIDNE